MSKWTIEKTDGQILITASDTNLISQGETFDFCSPTKGWLIIAARDIKQVDELRDPDCVSVWVQELRKEEFLHPEHVDPMQYIAAPRWHVGHERSPHDWTKYVPLCVRVRWDLLPLETKIIIYAICEEVADNEQWD